MLIFILSFTFYSNKFFFFIFYFFFFNDTATTEIYTLSLHGALPIWSTASNGASRVALQSAPPFWMVVPFSSPATVKAADFFPCVTTRPTLTLGTGARFAMASRPSSTQLGSKVSPGTGGNRKRPPQRINSRIAG